MTTFEELSEKGWKNLNAEEREEYQKLNPDKKEKKVEVSKVQLDGLMARLDALEAENKSLTKKQEEGEWEVDEEDFSGNRTAKLRTKEGRYLIDWEHNPQKGIGKVVFNPDSREKEYIYIITLLKEDGTTEQEEFAWQNLVHLPIEVVVLVDREVKKLKKIVGRTNKARVDFDEYKTTRGAEVPMEVKAERITYKCRLPDGREIKLDSSRLNA